MTQDPSDNYGGQGDERPPMPLMSGDNRSSLIHENGGRNPSMGSLGVEDGTFDPFQVRELSSFLKL